MSKNTQRVSGSCLCEGIAYEITGEIGPVFNCHCSKCRRWHGAAFRTRTSIKRDQFRWIKGEELLSTYNSSEDVCKYFCKNCGSPLISSYLSKPEVFGIALGGLEQDPGVRPKAHIFVDSKAPWYEISDDIPQFPDWPGDVSEVRKTHESKS